MKRNLTLIVLGLCATIPTFAQKSIIVNQKLSVDNALNIAKQSKEKKITINIEPSTYYLAKPVVISSDDFAEKQIAIIGKGKVNISGAQKHKVIWEKFKDNIYKASLKLEFLPDALFVNGQKEILARFPNYDANARIFNGVDSAATGKTRVKSWKNPTGGYLHAMHGGEWGSFHYKIIGKDANDNLLTEGGWQNNRPSALHKIDRFVENIFEELDAPNEWYYDKNAGVFYFYPASENDLKSGVIEVSFLQNLISVKGYDGNKIKNLRIENISFIQTQRTLFEPHEPLLRSDWKLHRDGAILLENTENIQIDNCVFTDLGSHAIMASGYNRNTTISNNHIYNIGQSAVCFVGEVSAVRNPSFAYEAFVPYKDLDLTPGPKNNKYPENCLVENNLIHNIGQVEKQATGVEISMSQSITVKNNTIYNTPRAGINIGDGTWGGHIIEYNDVFNSVQETGDHGAFNSWGRDRFWHPKWDDMDSLSISNPKMSLLDALKTTVIRNNRFRCDHGWDIDLDDGSGNYHIYNNICLNGGLKLREGMYRVVENNIIINNSFHPHVWFQNSQDVFRRNIVTRNYYPILVKTWGKEVDFNFFVDEKSLKKAQTVNHTDAHSIWGNPQFENADKGNYNLRPNSPAFKIGFKNIDEKSIGVQNLALKKIAQKVHFTPLVLPQDSDQKSKLSTFLNATVRSVNGLGDKSAYGLPTAEGLIVELIDNKALTQTGLLPKDVIVEAEGEKISSAYDLISVNQRINWKGKMNVVIYRNQQKQNMILKLK